LNSSNYNRQEGNYSNSWGNSYDRRENDYQSRTQRSSYDNYSRPYDHSQRVYEGNRNQPESPENALSGKKRRPRVGEANAPVRNTNYYPGNQHPAGNYNRDMRGGGYQKQQRPNARPFNRDNQGDRNMAPNPNAKYTVKKQLKYREEHFDMNEPIRLNKYLSNSGVCSRREADDFIRAGLVKVNGETVTELGVKVKRSDIIAFHNEPVKLEHKVYVLLNKPKNCVTTADDPQERLTVMDLVKNACRERIVPVGRLDRNTTGVLLLTNDGDLSSKLTHPKFLKKKIYHVWLDKEVSIADMQKLAEGIELEDGKMHADAVSYVSDTDKAQVGIEIHSGKNRVVRRMLEALGYHVIKLDRVYFAGLTKKNLKRGQWRYLNDREVSMLRMGAFD
jgi:23S rRNA pseudouridine2605 synthase